MDAGRLAADEQGLGDLAVGAAGGHQPQHLQLAGGEAGELAGLVCNLSGVGSADPNTGDTFTYLWNFGDGTATSTSSAMSHTFPSAGTRTVALTVTDGWGKAASTTRQVTVA